MGSNLGLILAVVFAVGALIVFALYFTQRKKVAALQKELEAAEQKYQDTLGRIDDPVLTIAKDSKPESPPPVKEKGKLPTDSVRGSDFLFATLSHELRTPLNGVLGIAQMLNESEEDNADLVALEGCARQMRSVVHTLVNLSKIKAEWGHLPQYSEWVSLYVLMEQIKKDLSFRAGTRGLKIVLDHEDNKLRLRCDMDHLDTIIECALLGSIESVDLGAVPQEKEELRIKWKADKDKVTVTIDNPIEKMPLNRGARIAEIMNADKPPVERLHMEFLYWAVSSALLEHYSGAMMAKQIQTGGVRTVLAFKMEQMKASPTSKRPIGGLRLDVGDRSPKALIELPENLSVLVAEDDPINRELMNDLLSRMNQTPTFAKNGQEVLDILANDESFDLILMDIDMPVLDGLSTAYNLRAGEVGPYGEMVPIIALTAFNTLSDQSKFKAAGMNYFLAKPVGIRELRDVFIEVIRNKGQLVQ